MIKLIATDMDGTLVNSKKELPDDIFNIINRLHEQHVTFVVASGRQYYNLLALFKPVKDKVVFIAENGGLIFYRGNNLHTESMDNSDLSSIIDAISNIPHLHPILCGTKAAYYVPDDDDFIANAHLYFSKYRYVTNLKQALKFDDICKIAIYDSSNAETNCYPAVKHLESQYKVTLSDSRWVDICNTSTNKGKAIEIIQKNLNVTPNETMIFGDYMNDAEMMTKCYYSYAMANAHPELKKLCNYEAPSNDDNGVVKTIMSECFAGA